MWLFSNEGAEHLANYATVCICNDDRYGEKEAGTGEHLNTFNQINKHKWKAAAPHGRLPHTKHKLKCQAWSSLVFHCRHSSFYSFRSSSVGLETGEWRRCRSLSFTPPASLRSHSSQPRPTRHSILLHWLAIDCKQTECQSMHWRIQRK